MSISGFFIIEVLFLSFFLLQKPTYASVVHGRTCTLGVLPYNPTASFDTQITQSLAHINILDEADCITHVRDNGYVPQPPLAQQNLVKSGSESMRVSEVGHGHAYFNDADHSRGDVFYKSFMDRFEIILQPDAVRNIDMNRISCFTPTPPGFNRAAVAGLDDDCDGYAPDLFGGTTVSKVIGQDGTRIIRWQFATRGQGGRPNIYGNNGSNFIPFDASGNPTAPLDLTDPINRKLEFSVVLRTRDGGQIWSATTSSRALIADQVIAQSTYRNPNIAQIIQGGCVAGGWCYTTTPLQFKNQTEPIVTPSGRQEYYWFPIGKFGTVWKKPVSSSAAQPQPQPTPPPVTLPPGSSPQPQPPSVSVPPLNVPSPSPPSPPSPPPPSPPVLRRPEIPRPPPEMPDFVITKKSFVKGENGNVIKKDHEAQFRISLHFRSPGSPVPKEVTIQDNFGTELRGDKAGKISHIKLDGKDFKVEKRKSSGGDLVPVGLCSSQLQLRRPTSLCYEGNLFASSALKIKNLTNETVIITYAGKLIESKINRRTCRDFPRNSCGEKFINTVTAMVDSQKYQASDTLYTPCPFLLTQGIGDVILERDLAIGADISSCAGIPNIEGEAIIPPPPPGPRPIPKVGPDSVVNIPPHTLCQKSNEPAENGSKQRPKAYVNPLESLSSALCEVSLDLAERVRKPKIQKNVLENITRLTRYNNTLGEGDKIIWNLNEPPVPPGQMNLNPHYQIYKLKNGNLTVDSFIPLQQSRTFIVENGDLVIKKNITYAPTNFRDLKSIKNIPVVAFIIINGNIKIDASVTNLSGVYVTLKGSNQQSGKILGIGLEREKSLKIEGAVYGDIEPLFAHSNFIGDPRRGEGTITINYDGRLFYNVPPGLQEVLDISGEQVVR